jgi:tetratricopeptide (TPR) repeat protein
MKRFPVVAVVLSLLLASAQAQRTLVIPAGTPEDVALQEISRITDAAERAERLQAFVEEFAASPAAVAFGHWQLAQHYEAQGDAARALQHGDKALEAAPGNLDILVSQVQLAQQAGDAGRLFDYAVRGGEAYHALPSEPLPAGVDEETHQQRLREDMEAARATYEFLEVAAFNAIVAQEDGARRMEQIDRYLPAFPGSRFDEQIAQYAIYTLQQMNQPERLASWGERALKANPESIPTLVMLASALSEEPKGANL